MEALAFHPSQKFFLMAGRLVQGQWNLAFFDSANGKSLHSLTPNTGSPMPASLWTASACCWQSQTAGEKKDGKWPDYGLVEIYALT